MIHVSHLSKSFKVFKKKAGLSGSLSSVFKRDYSQKHAVEDISFDIEEGEFVGFIGPNGAGKTTTLKMLSGLLYPSEGKVSVMGYEPFDREYDFLRKIALVLGQKRQLWWDLPPIESFVLNKEIYDIPDKEFKETLNNLTDLLDVNDILEVQVRNLSLGQRMKCEIIAQLLHRPKVLFLDEPTIGLDVVMQHSLRDFLREYNKTYNATIILTSHYMKDVQDLCERILLINNGKLLYDGNLESFVTKHTPKKFIKIVFSDKVLKKDLSKYGTIISFDKTFATLSIPKEKAMKSTAEIIQKFPVIDISIEDPDIEKVIRNVFTSQK